jgi:hypothetical protein
MNKHELIKLKLGILCDELSQCVENENQCYKIISKSDLSRLKVEKDHERDIIIVAIKKLIDMLLLHFEPAKRDAAHRIKIVIEVYDNPTSIISQSYNVETVTIYNLITILETDYADDVEITGLKEWLQELKIRNDAFAKLATDYTEEQSKKTTSRSKELREKTDEAYNNVIEAVDGLVQLEGVKEYAPFIAEVNELGWQYDTLYAQHLGGLHAKKEKEEAEKKAKEEAEKKDDTKTDDTK